MNAHKRRNRQDFDQCAKFTAVIRASSQLLTTLWLITCCIIIVLMCFIVLHFACVIVEYIKYLRSIGLQTSATRCSMLQQTRRTAATPGYGSLPARSVNAPWVNRIEWWYTAGVAKAFTGSLYRPHYDMTSLFAHKHTRRIHTHTHICVLTYSTPRKAGRPVSPRFIAESGGHIDNDLCNFAVLCLSYRQLV